MKSFPSSYTTRTSNGSWRIVFDEEGEIVSIELWETKAGVVKTYEALRVIH